MPRDAAVGGRGPHPPGVPAGVLGAPGRPPRLGRGLHHPPPRGRRHRRARHRLRRPLRRRRPPPRRRRGHRVLARLHPRGVWRADGGHHRRPHQDLRRLRQPRVGPGRERPQAHALDGDGHPRHPRQVRRPPPQHAHARLAPARAPAQDRQRDHRALRPAGPPVRLLHRQERAGGPLAQGARAAGVLRHRGRAPGDEGGARGVHRRLYRPAPRAAAAGRVRRRPLRAVEEHLLGPTGR